MSYADNTLGYAIQTKEQALNWIVDEVSNLKGWRTKLDIACLDLSGKSVGSVGDVRKEFRKFLIRYGSVLGTLVALHRVGFLSDEQYQQIQGETTVCLMECTSVLRE